MQRWVLSNEKMQAPLLWRCTVALLTKWRSIYAQWKIAPATRTDALRCWLKWAQKYSLGSPMWSTVLPVGTWKLGVDVISSAHLTFPPWTWNGTQEMRCHLWFIQCPGKRAATFSGEERYICVVWCAMLWIAFKEGFEPGVAMSPAYASGQRPRKWYYPYLVFSHYTNAWSQRSLTKLDLYKRRDTWLAPGSWSTTAVWRCLVMIEQNFFMLP